MKLTGCEGELLRRLAEMPFLDRMELTAVSGWSKGAVYRGVRRLEEGGLAAPVPHATDLIPLTGRFHLTAAGLRRLAQWDGMRMDELLRTRPVSARWRRILLERLDAVAAVYRLASAVSNIAYPMRFRWYRAAPMDAAIELSGGRTLAVVRQGLAADRTGFAKRVWRLWEGPIPGAVLVLVPDEARLRHARRLLTGGPGRRRRARLASAVHRRGHRPGVGAGPDTAGRRSSCGTAALGSVPPLGHSRRPSGAGPSRPHAARPSQARREARPRPALRLALDIAEGPGGPDGRLGAAGVPAGDSPRRLRPRGPPARRRGRRSRPGPTPGSHRRGAGGAGPQGPRLRGRGEEALERHPRRPGSPPLLAQRVGRGKQAASQERGAHHGGAWLHRGPGPAVPLPGLEAGPDRPAPEGVEILQARRPARAGGRAGCAPSTPTPSASCAGAGPRGPSSWSGSAAPCGPRRWRNGSPHTCATTPPAAPSTTTAHSPPSSSSSTTTWRRPTSCGWQGRRWTGPGSESPCGSPTGGLSTPWGLWDGPGALPVR